MYVVTLYFVDLKLDAMQKKLVDEFVERSRFKYQEYYRIYAIFSKDYILNSIKDEISVVISTHAPQTRTNQYFVEFFTLSGLENELNRLFISFKDQILEFQAIQAKELEIQKEAKYSNYLKDQESQKAKLQTKQNLIKTILDEYIKSSPKERVLELIKDSRDDKLNSMVEALYKIDIDKQSIINISSNLDKIDLDELLEIFKAKESLKNYGNISIGGDESMSIGSPIKPIDQSAKRGSAKMANIASNIAIIDPFKGLFK